jgi:hypothetical protein
MRCPSLALAGLLAVFAGSCGNDEAPRACAPLEAMTRPITLGKVIGAGKAANGDIFVADQSPDGTYRAFVARAGVLQRIPVGGTGSVGSGPGSWVSLGAELDGAPITLKVEVDDQGRVHVGLLHGMPAPPAKTFTIGAAGETLETLDASAVSGLPVRNLPGTIHLEHFATSDDGNRIVVTAPDVDERYQDFRLFYGPPAGLLERHIVDVSRGSYTNIRFTVDGREATAVFSSPLSPGVESTLSIGGTRHALVLAPTGAAVDGLSFLCTDGS